MNDLPMHPIPECLRLFQINRDGPATVSCAEGVRCSSPARQRGAPPPSMRPGLIWVKLRSLSAQLRSPFCSPERTSPVRAVRSEKCQQATSQACPDMNEAANQGGLRDDRCAGRSERCRTILQHRKLAPFTSDLYKSRDICGSFLRLVRPTRPC
jgi:hypothetical protein